MGNEEEEYGEASKKKKKSINTKRKSRKDEEEEETERLRKKIGELYRYGVLTPRGSRGSTCQSARFVSTFLCSSTANAATMVKSTIRFWERRRSRSVPYSVSRNVIFSSNGTSR